MYRKQTEDPVTLLEYIKFSDEKAKEKYLVFKFKNNLTQRLKEIKVLVNLFDENDYLIGTTTFVYKNFIAKGLEEFVPTAKLLVNYNTKHVEVKVVYALFDTLSWEEDKFTKLQNVSLEENATVETKKLNKKEETVKVSKGSRKAKLKDISKGNRIVFPKILVAVLCVVLIGVTFYGVWNVSKGGSLSDDNFKYEKKSSSEVSIVEYIGEDTEVIIPEKYKKYSVVTIDSKAFEGSDITSVTFSGGKINIKSGAFTNCEELFTVEDENDTEILVSKSGFKNCPNLESVILPNAKLSNDAFVDCDQIITLSINSIEGTELSDCGVYSKLANFSIATGELSTYFFDGYSNVKTLVLVNDVVVSGNCFKKLPKLTKLYIGQFAEVPPTSLASYIKLSVYLHSENEFYSKTDYSRANSNLVISSYK